MKFNLGQVVTSHGHCQTRNFIIQIDHLSICCILEKSSMGFEFFPFLLYLSKHCVVGRVCLGFTDLCLDKGLWVSLSYQGNKRPFERDLGCCDGQVICSPSLGKKISGHRTAKTWRHGPFSVKLETFTTPAITFKDREDTDVVTILQRKEGLNPRAGREGSAEQSASLPSPKPQVIQPCGHAVCTCMAEGWTESRLEYGKLSDLFTLCTEKNLHSGA